jgi:hypothetical protein
VTLLEPDRRRGRRFPGTDADRTSLGVTQADSSTIGSLHLGELRGRPNRCSFRHAISVLSLRPLCRCCVGRRCCRHRDRPDVAVAGDDAIYFGRHSDCRWVPIALLLSASRANQIRSHIEVRFGSSAASPRRVPSQPVYPRKMPAAVAPTVGSLGPQADVAPTFMPCCPNATILVGRPGRCGTPSM